MQQRSTHPKVTIAIPAYKKAFLANAIESVLKQTYTNIELIIVNDKSPEDIDSVIKQFHDSRIKYYKNEFNIGGKDPVANWNKCLSYATGDFFALLCDDDLYETTFIEELLKLAQKYPQTNVFRTRVGVINSTNQYRDLYPTSPEWESTIDYIWHLSNNYRRQTISEFMYRIQPILDIGGYTSLPKAWCADFVSVLRFSQKGGIVSSPQILTKFRMSGINISTADNKFIKEKIEAQIKYTTWIKKLLSQESPNNDQLNMILKAREKQEDLIISAYLTLTTIKDFFFLWGKRKSDKYKIKNKCFGKAFIKKIQRIIIG